MLKNISIIIICVMIQSCSFMPEQKTYDTPTGATNDAYEALKANKTDDFIAALKNGVDLNAKLPPAGFNFLQVAINFRNLDATKEILPQFKEKINDHENNMGLTAIMIASMHYKPEDAANRNKDIYNYYANAWSEDPDRDSKLEELKKKLTASENPADYAEPADFIKLLLDAGADPNIPNPAGNTPLHESIEKKNIKAVQLLLDAKANIEWRRGIFQRDQFPTPLFAAVLANDYAIIKLLLKYGADKDAVMDQYFNDPVILKKYNIDPDKVSMVNVVHTPLSLANFLNNENAQKALNE